MTIVSVSTATANFRSSVPISGSELNQVQNYGQRVIAPGAATYQLKKSESGSLVMFDSVAVAVTLPELKDATDIGMNFDFFVAVTTTSAHSVTTATTAQFLGGGVLAYTIATASPAGFAANDASHRTLSMNGTTKGGIIGTKFSVTAVTTTQWVVSGMTVGSGTVITPFA